MVDNDKTSHGLVAGFGRGSTAFRAETRKAGSRSTDSRDVVIRTYRKQIPKMTEDMTDDELNLKLERMRTENAQTFANAVKEISEVKSELARLPRTWTLIALVATVAGLLLGAMALAFDRFDGGVQIGVSVPMEAQIELNKQQVLALTENLQIVTSNQAEILSAIQDLSPVPEQRLESQ